MIKNIIFDMGNVLLTYAPHDYIKTIIDDEVIAAAVLKELFYSKEWLELDAGAITEEKAVMQISLRLPQYAQYVQRAMDQWHSGLMPIEGMSEIVKRLKDKGYKIYLLSNVSLRFLKFRDEVEMFRYFDGFIASAQEKVVKPNKEIYERLCKRFNLNCEECLFIDDLQVNIDGAVNAGIHGHLFLGARALSDYLERENIL